MKRIILILTLLLSSVASSVAIAKTGSASHFSAGQMAEGAPAELMHWGKLVGQWTTKEESLKTDGSGWDDAGGADWDLFWAFDGWGIQDNYTSPSKSTPMKDESKRQRGTNLRIYNAELNKWILTWLTTTSSQPQFYTANSNEKQIIMLSDVAGPNENFSRITFFDMSETSFEWKLEWSKDQQTWQEVYRIHGSKKSQMEN